MYRTRGDVEELFRYEHLEDPVIKGISKTYFDMAMRMCDLYTADMDRDNLLNKLWETKNLEVWLAAGGHDK